MSPDDLSKRTKCDVECPRNQNGFLSSVRGKVLECSASWLSDRINKPLAVCGVV